jgi:hypothetical protein
MHQQQLCPICSNSLMNAANYCFNCGYALESKSVNSPTQTYITTESPLKFSQRVLSALGVLLKSSPVMLLSVGVCGCDDCDDTGCCIIDCCGSQCEALSGGGPNPYSRYT